MRPILAKFRCNNSGVLSAHRALLHRLNLAAGQIKNAASASLKDFAKLTLTVGHMCVQVESYALEIKARIITNLRQQKARDPSLRRYPAYESQLLGLRGTQRDLARMK